MNGLETKLGPDGTGAAFAAWRAALSPIHDVSLPRGSDPGAFMVEGATFSLPHGFLTQARASAQIMRRPAELIGRSPINTVFFFFLREGHLVADYAGRGVSARPGSIVFGDYGRPILSVASRFSALSLTLERERVPVIFRSGVAHGVALDAGRPIAALLGGMIDAIFAQIADLTAGEAEAAVDGILAVAAQAWSDAAPDGLNRRDQLRNRAALFVRAHLGDAELSPEQIASALGVSRTALYAAFQGGGGVGTFIRHERLDAALRTLISDPGASPRSVSALAYDLGFTSDAHFSRSFRARFGHSPRDIARMLVGGGAHGQRETDWSRKRGASAGGTVVQGWLESAADVEPAGYSS